MMQPPVILLREGTDTSQGIGQLVSNINACSAVAEVIRTTLGPCGMDKLIHSNGKSTISNDGAELMNLLDIVHPAAKTLADIAQSQDVQVGDGTTSVVLIAAQFLKNAKQFVEDGMHPMIIIRGYRNAMHFALKTVHKLATVVSEAPDEQRQLLERCAMTSLNSKLIRGHKEFFSKMIVDAVLSLGKDDMNLRHVGIKKIQGGGVTESRLIRGVAFKKTFSYAGFEQMKKQFVNPKILALNVELELKSEKENAEIRIEDPSEYQSIVDAEWKIIYDKLEKCVESGAQIILSRLPIGDLATQYFADRGLFCAGRVDTQDLERVSRATGTKIQTSVNGIVQEALGSCGKFEELQVGGDRFNVFTECTDSRTSTLLLRGGAEQFLEESHRSVWDALNIVKRCIQNNEIVAGGGAIEMEVSKALREYARTIPGKEQLVINAYAKSLEIIPQQLCDNAGFDSTDVLNALRKKHHTEGGAHYGVDIDNDGICDTFAKFVWEPAASKINSYASATEAATQVLCVDETVRNPQSEGAARAMGRGRGGRAPPGGGLSQAMGGRGMAGMMGRGVRKYQGKGGR
jgi:T-complex protein 1 subunit eta